MSTTKNTARNGAGEAAALTVTSPLCDHRPLADGDNADTLLFMAGVLPADASEPHLSSVLSLNRAANMKELCVAIRLRARAARGTLTLLESSESIDEAHRDAASGAGMLIDELCGLAAAVEITIRSYDRAGESAV